MFGDDAPENGMTFVVEFEFSGCVNREHFQAAVDAAIQRHPILRCVVQRAKANKECWVPIEDFDATVRWIEAGDEIRIEGVGV
ncbi:MAG: chromosome condensation protein, partial [Planctomycetota bacterium]